MTGGDRSTRPGARGQPSSRLGATRQDVEQTHADGSRHASGSGSGRSPGLGPGSRFAGTTIVAELGRGAMGRVFRARDGLGRDVALKVLLRAPDPEELERFVREGQAMAAVPPHPGVVAVHSAGVQGGVPYLVMDMVEGDSLADRVAGRTLPPERARAVGAQLADALAHVHEAGVIHRDLKPANVLVRREDGQPRLTDFGLADVSGAERLTLTGDVLGTPLYMPPEQILGQRSAVGPAADVWALGALIYEMAAGEPPFSGMDLEHQTRLVTRSEPRPLPDAELWAIVGRALQKDAAARPTAAELAAALHGPLPEGWLEAPPVPRRRRPRWLAPALAGAGVALALIGVAVTVAVQRQRRRAGWRAEATRLVERAGALDPGNLLDRAAGAPDAAAELAGAVAALRVTAGPLDLGLEPADRALLRARLAHALEHEAWDDAARLVEAASTEPLEAVLQAHLDRARGRPLDAAALRVATEGGSPGVAEAAAVLLARELARTDGAEAVRLLASRTVGRELAARERRRIRAFQAIAHQDLRALDAALDPPPEPAALKEVYRFGLEPLREALRREDPRAAAAALELLARLRAAAPDVAAEFGESPPARALARDVCEVVGEAAKEDRTRQAAQTLDALARSGLRPEDQDLRALGEELFYRLRTRDDGGIQVMGECLTAFVRLDYPMPPRTLRGPRFMELSRHLGTGLEVRYLELRARALQGTTHEEVAGARRRLQELIQEAEADGTLGPRSRAQALAEAFEDTSLSAAERAEIAAKVRRLDPRSPWGYALLARVLAERGEREAAVASLEQGELEYGRRYGPLLREILQHRVFVYALLGDAAAVEQSLTDLEAAIGASDATVALRALAERLLEQSRK